MVRHTPKPEWSYADTLSRLQDIPDDHIRLFSLASYVLGGRLNEIRAIKPADVSYYLDENKNKFFYTTLISLKHRRITKKGTYQGEASATRVIPTSIKNEPHYAQALNEVALTKPKNQKIFQEYSDRTYRKKVRQYLDLKPHNLRHLRARHLAKGKVPGQKELNAPEMCYFFGWIKYETARYYLEQATPQEIGRKMNG